MAELLIVIPALNAEIPLARLLKQVKGHRVIVSDGGSEDGTLAVAVKAGAVIAAGSPGRGQQLARGVAFGLRNMAEDAWVLALHADTVLPEGWEALVAGHMERSTKAAYFGYGPVAGLSAAERVILRAFVRLREVAWGLPYGDQGLLMSAELYARVGGYAEMALFEDVDLVKRINRAAGRMVRLKGDVETDAQGYGGQLWRKGWRNLRLLRAYRKGASVEALVARYRGGA